MKKIILFLILYMLFLSCNREKNNIKIDYYANGKIKEIILSENESIIKYGIKFDDSGRIDSILQKNNDSTNIKFSFYKNGNLESYTKSKNNYIQNSYIEFDSLSNIAEVDISNYIIDGNYLNQVLVFNPYGIISSSKSYYLVIEEKLIGKEKASLSINLIGGGNKKCYAIIGNYDKYYNLTDKSKVDTINGVNNKINAEINIYKGLNYIRGKVIDIKGDETREVYFTKEIFYKGIISSHDGAHL